MKKVLSLFFAACLSVALLCGCSGKNTPSEKADEQSSIQSEKAPLPEKSNSDVDIDLTKMSSTMVYSQVYDMVYSSDDYIGKIIKMKGKFSVFEIKDEGLIYFSCLISDATACCSQGIEFVLKGDPVYPNDYPKEDSEITVVGMFDTYYEGISKYCHLINAEII